MTEEDQVEVVVPDDCGVEILSSDWKAQSWLWNAVDVVVLCVGRDLTRGITARNWGSYSGARKKL